MSETNSDGPWGADGSARASLRRAGDLAGATRTIGQLPAWERSVPGEPGEIEVDLGVRDIARFWRSHGPIEQGHLVAALAFELAEVRSVALRERGIGLLVRVDPELAARVARRLGMAPAEGGSRSCSP